MGNYRKDAMSCWKHDWVITEDRSNSQAGPGPTDKSDWAAFLFASAFGSCAAAIPIALVMLKLLGMTPNPGNVWVLFTVWWCLWVLSIFIFYSHIWNGRNAGCTKCKSVWLGLTKSQDKVEKWAVEQAKRIRETTELVAKRKEMFRKSRC